MLEAIEIGALFLCAAVGTLILHNASESNMKSKASTVDVPQTSLLDDLQAFKDELKYKAISGFAWLSAKIWFKNKLEEQARIKSIEDSFEASTSTLGESLSKTIGDINLINSIASNVNSSIMEGAHKAIDSIPVSNDIELNVNDFWVPEKEAPSIEWIPPVEKESPIIIDAPPKIEIEPIIDFPAIPKQEPQITGVPADSGVEIPNISGIPANNSQSLESIILRTTTANNEIQRTDEIELEFHRNSNHDKDEFEQQIKDQEEGLNNLSIAEYLKNRISYKENGRSKEGAKAQRKARKSAERKKQLELISKYKMSLDEAKEKAKEWIKTQAALHNPDQAAGGNPTNITRVGDAAINKSIGSQWRKNAVILEEQVRKYIKDHNLSETSEELKNIYLKVKLKF